MGDGIRLERGYRLAREPQAPANSVTLTDLEETAGVGELEHARDHEEERDRVGGHRRVVHKPVGVHAPGDVVLVTHDWVATQAVHGGAAVWCQKDAAEDQIRTRNTGLGLRKGAHPEREADVIVAPVARDHDDLHARLADTPPLQELRHQGTRMTMVPAGVPEGTAVPKPCTRTTPTPSAPLSTTPAGQAPADFGPYMVYVAGS